MADEKFKSFLNFTGLDYAAIRQQIEDELNRDPRFETFRESAIAKTIMDVFAATTDLTNYYIERRAEEQFLETARLRSSAIALSRILGYVVRRPIPAKSGLNIILSGPLPSGLVAGEKVTFQKQNTTFTAEGVPYLLKNSYTYTFTSDDLTAGIGNPDFQKIISFAVNLSGTEDTIPLDTNGNVDSRSLADIEILQGELKTHTILGSTNNLTGQLFQKYKIEDTTFSNLYGDEDVTFNAITNTSTLAEDLTKIGIGSTQTEAFQTANLFTINRRSLIDPTQLTSDLTNVPNIALIRSTMSEGVDINFGDDKFSSKGADTSDDNIYIQYFSTQGAKGNKVGVIDNELKSPNSFITDLSTNVTNNISFTFFRNVTEGSDMESIDSIKLNAPEIFFSLDRLVTSRDYIAYLKTQTIGDTGGPVINAVAWGEQEEIIRRSQKANFRFFNVAFFSPLGEIYNFPTGGEFGILEDADIHNAYLESADDFSTITETTSGIVSADGYPEQVYFNILVKEAPQPEVERVEDFRQLNTTHPITRMYDKINLRSQMTVKNIYITPIVQKFKLKGRVTLGKLEDRQGVKKSANNKIYEFLNENADFAVNIQKSSIYDIIQDFSEIKSSNIFFEPTVPEKLLTTFEEDPDFIEATTAMAFGTSTLVKTAYTDAIDAFITSAGYARLNDSTSDSVSANLDINITSASSLPGAATSGIWDASGFPDPWFFEDVGHRLVGNVSEKSFYTELMKDIYDNLQSGGSPYTLTNGDAFRDSQNFKNIMFKMHNDLIQVIRASMLDSEGNITMYSLNNEIAQVKIELDYQFE